MHVSERIERKKALLVSLRHPFRHHHPVDKTLPVHRLIVPVSGGEGDRRLLEVVEKIASHENVDITIIYVVEVLQSMPLDAELPREIARGEQVLLQAEATAGACVAGKKSAIRTELLQARSAGAAIVDEAIEHGAHAIVLGATVRKKFGRPSTGETLNYVLLNAPCEVIVIRHAQPGWTGSVMESL